MKMLPSRTIWITEYIHPPEADRLADAFGRASGSMCQSASRTDQVNACLTQGWEGRQAAQFLDASQGVPPEMRFCADWLSAQEQKFRTITVTVRRQVTVPVYSS
jgi:uncharacterized protein YukE